MAFFKKKIKEKKIEEKAVKAPIKDAKKEVKKTIKKNSSKSSVKGMAYKSLVHPLITEKSTIQNSLNQYAFVVSNKTNKVEIAKAVEEVYGIKPTKVRVLNMIGKQVRSGRGKLSRHKSWKKAVVTIPAGKKIDIYEGV